MKISISGLLVLIMSAFLITSCSSEHNEDQQNTPVAIALTSNVDVISRSSLQNVQIVKDQEVGFFVKKAAPASGDVYSNAKLTADGNGGFKYEPTMYYPISNENVDFYAYHPFEATTPFGSPLSFNVKADQSVKANYLNSDLLYAQELNIAKTTSAVPMKFYHKLSQLNFTIKKGTGMDLSGMTSVEVLGLLPGTTINLSNGSITDATGDATPIKVYGVRGTAEGEDGVSGMSAIVIPQAAVKDNKLFKVAVNGVLYYYTPTADITFEPGKKYSYILTINHAGITVTSTIEDWVSSGDPIEGDGTLG